MASSNQPRRAGNKRIVKRVLDAAEKEKTYQAGWTATKALTQLRAPKTTRSLLQVLDRPNEERRHFAAYALFGQFRNGQLTQAQITGIRKRIAGEKSGRVRYYLELIGGFRKR
jgi:hypothetical protein